MRKSFSYSIHDSFLIFNAMSMMYDGISSLFIDATRASFDSCEYSGRSCVQAASEKYVASFPLMISVVSVCGYVKSKSAMMLPYPAQSDSS